MICKKTVGLIILDWIKIDKEVRIIGKKSRGILTTRRTKKGTRKK